MSPLLWYTTLSEVLLQYGLSRSFREPCLFYLVSEGIVTLVLTFVDDIMVASGSREVSWQIVQHLQRHFAVTCVEHPKTYVGFELNYDPDSGTLCIHQTTYAKEIVETFLPDNEKFPKKVPMNLFGNFPKLPNAEELSDPHGQYRSILGSLYYLANMTRPDILFAVNYLSRSQASPTRLHQKLLTLVLRYVFSTTGLALSFRHRHRETYQHMWTPILGRSHLHHSGAQAGVGSRNKWSYSITKDISQQRDVWCCCLGIQCPGYAGNRHC